MKKTLILLLIVFSVLLTTAQAAVLRVGSGSWGTSFATIQEAVNAASPNDEIWVKQGTYSLSTYMTLDKAVILYGGFNGTESLLSQRNWTLNVTTIDGQNLATCLFVTGDATLDGFTITNGNANPAIVSNPVTNQPSGGGIFNLFCSVLVSNCIIKGNHADYCGGGIMNMGGDMTITNCIFFGNTAVAGGAIYNSIGNLTVVNSTFSLNSASAGNGGGIHNYGYTGHTCTLTMFNSILWGDTGGEIIVRTGVTASVSYSDIQGGFSGTGNINKDPLFVNTGIGNYHLQSTSPCIDVGTNSGAPSTDIEDIPRPQGPSYDMGAYEYVPTTFIALSSFTAAPKSNRVILEWTTESEIDNTGFNIYRSESEKGNYTKINTSQIPAQGSSTQGASYELIDNNVQNRKTYYYKLEDIDLNSNSTMHGPVSATPRWILGIFGIFKK